MKKILAILISLSMLICFTACGDNNGDDVRGEIKENNQATAENSEDTQQDTQGETQKISLGQSEGSTYDRTFIGLGWTLPEGWNFLSDEQMNQMNNIVADMLDSEQLQAAIEKASVICDMYAINYTNGSTINIQLEKLSAMANVVYDANTYVDTTIGQLSSSLEMMGYTDIQITKTTINVAGTEHPGIALQATLNGVAIYQRMACIKVGDYMCVIATATALEDSNDSIFANFYALEK